MAAMSGWRMRVASSDWCASRIVVSVSSTRFCSSIHLAKPSAPSSSSFCFVPGGGALDTLTFGSRASAICLGLQAPLHLRIAVDDDVADEVQDARGAVALLRPLEQLGRLVDELGGVVGRGELRMRDHLVEETQVGGHAADAELPQRAMHARDGLDGFGAQAVTFTSIESYERVMIAPA